MWLADLGDDEQRFMLTQGISILLGRRVEGVEGASQRDCVIRFEGGFSLRIASLWRLVSCQRLRLTSQDEGQRYGHDQPVNALALLSDELTGMKVSTIEAMEGTADLMLGLGEKVLQILSDSSGYEAWELLGPEGPIAVGQGGGHIQMFR